MGNIYACFFTPQQMQKNNKHVWCLGMEKVSSISVVDLYLLEQKINNFDLQLQKYKQKLKLLQYSGSSVMSRLIILCHKYKLCYFGVQQVETKENNELTLITTFYFHCLKNMLMYSRNCGTQKHPLYETPSLQISSYLSAKRAQTSSRKLWLAYEK